MRNLGENFNRSALSRFLNSLAGRVFRVAAGAGFLVLGFVYRSDALGPVAAAWSLLPLSAGGFDVCYISAFLGGPFSGKRIRSAYQSGNRPGGAA